MNLKRNTNFNNFFTNMLDELINTMVNNNSTPNHYVNDTNNVYGNTTVERGTDADGNTWVKTTYTSNDGSYTYTTEQTTGNLTNTPWGSNNNPWWGNKAKYDTNDYNATYAGKNYTDRLTTLREELNRAVTEQKYEEAARLKKELDYALKTDSEYSSLQKELETAVKAHNYERAIEVRDSIREYENRYALNHTNTYTRTNDTTTNQSTTSTNDTTPTNGTTTTSRKK